MTDGYVLKEDIIPAIRLVASFSGLYCSITHLHDYAINVTFSRQCSNNVLSFGTIRLRLLWQRIENSLYISCFAIKLFAQGLALLLAQLLALLNALVIAVNYSEIKEATVMVKFKFKELHQI